jgi:hypothetical protein
LDNAALAMLGPPARDGDGVNTSDKSFYLARIQIFTTPVDRRAELDATRV